MIFLCCGCKTYEECDEDNVELILHEHADCPEGERVVMSEDAFDLMVAAGSSTIPNGVTPR